MPADRIGDDAPVITVEDGAHIDLAVTGFDFGDVGEPLPVGRLSAEVTVQKVVGGWRAFADVRTVMTALPGGAGLQSLLAHDAAHRLLRDHRPIPFRHGVDTTGAVAGVGLFERRAHQWPQPIVFVKLQPRMMVMIRAQGQ